MNLFLIGNPKDATYGRNNTIFGLKPYIYYSCRYIDRNGKYDIVIIYTLDSCISIKGTINGQVVNISGYLLSGVSNNGGKYRGIEIESEDNKEGLKQKVYIPNLNQKGNINYYQYRKVNGVKYYWDAVNNQAFSIINDEMIPSTNISKDKILKNDNAVKFYEEAYKFKEGLLYGTVGDDHYDILNTIKDLSTNDAVNENGEYYNTKSDNPFSTGIKIFDELTNTSLDNKPYIEDENSNFNMHRKEVIRNAIETNLTSAISNYKAVEDPNNVDINYQMPKLQEDEWYELTNSINMITFLQGLSIGGKVYNGYSIVPNNVNDDFVSENSIYVMEDKAPTDNYYYRFTDKHVYNESGASNINLDNSIGMFNTDFERRTVIDSWKDLTNSEEHKDTWYYYPREDLGSYTSIIALNERNNFDFYRKDYSSSSLSTDTNNNECKLAKLFYTALGRERYGIGRVTTEFAGESILY